MKFVLTILVILSVFQLSNSYSIEGEVMASYVNTVTSWVDGNIMLRDLGTPSLLQTPYNIFLLAFWLSDKGPVDAALIWHDPATYTKGNSKFGRTNQEIKPALVQDFKSSGKKILLSAFGATNMPTSQDATTVCRKLGQYVKDHNYDGVDLDYEDSGAFNVGSAEQWLITCTKELRKILPRDQYILGHAPQGPYFTGTHKYPKGGYLKVHAEVGDDIDYYFVQYYNQGSTTYDSYQTLFKQSNGWCPGTSVKEMMAKGIPKEKIIIGKPVKTWDAYNTGWVNAADLGRWVKQARSDPEIMWDGGVFIWKSSSDLDNHWINAYLQNAGTFPKNIKKGSAESNQVKDSNGRAIRGASSQGQGRPSPKIPDPNSGNSNSPRSSETSSPHTPQQPTQSSSGSSNQFNSPSSIVLTVGDREFSCVKE